MKKILIISMLLVSVGISGGPGTGFCADRSPYGGYTGSEGYGEKRPVYTVEDAYSRLKNYFGGKSVTIGEIKEKELFFEAEILDNQNRVVDKVIIDKRTGRIRSIF